MTNIEDFNRGVTLIMAELYSHFPEPVNIKVAALDPDKFAELAEAQRRNKVYGHAMVFLKDEGYIRFNSMGGKHEQFAGVVLTSKGLAALNKTPQSLSEDSYGSTLFDLAKAAANGATAEAFKQIVHGILS